MLGAALARPETQYYFCPGRRWHFDFAWPDYLFYAEIEGGSWGKIVECNHCHQRVSRMTRAGKLSYIREGLAHTTGEGYAKNCEKYNEAALRGWRGLRFTTNMVRDGSALDSAKRMFEPREPVKIQATLW